MAERIVWALKRDKDGMLMLCSVSSSREILERNNPSGVNSGRFTVVRCRLVEIETAAAGGQGHE